MRCYRKGGIQIDSREERKGKNEPGSVSTSEWQPDGTHGPASIDRWLCVWPCAVHHLLQIIAHIVRAFLFLFPSCHSSHLPFDINNHLQVSDTFSMSKRSPAPPPGIYVPAVIFYNEDESIDDGPTAEHVLRLAKVEPLILIL